MADTPIEQQKSSGDLNIGDRRVLGWDQVLPQAEQVPDLTKSQEEITEQWRPRLEQPPIPPQNVPPAGVLPVEVPPVAPETLVEAQDNAEEPETPVNSGLDVDVIATLPKVSEKNAEDLATVRWRNVAES